jgi:hypothetical protein
MTKPENEKKPRERDEIFSLLLERTARSRAGYDRPRDLPPYKLPGKVAFLLDDLLESAASGLGRGPEDALAEVVELGIATWYCQLLADQRERIGLGGCEVFDGEACGQSADQLQLSLARNEPRGVTAPAPLPRGRHEDDDIEDPNPAAAQQKADAYAYQTGAFGYTPMTIHTLAEGGKGQSHPKSGPRPGKKHRPPVQDGGRRSRKNRGRKRPG